MDDIVPVADCQSLGFMYACVHGNVCRPTNCNFDSSDDTYQLPPRSIRLVDFLALLELMALLAGGKLEGHDSRGH
jgi:hypothetical protein